MTPINSVSTTITRNQEVKQTYDDQKTSNQSVEVDSNTLNTATLASVNRERLKSELNTEQTNNTNSVSSPSVLRVTQSVAQYDVSAQNPKALANLAKALAGSLHRPELTFYDPETNSERELGDVLVSMNISNPNEIVLQHRDTAGKGMLGRLVTSIGFVVTNPIKTLAMKWLGIVADPEKVYVQKVIQTLSTLDQNGMFGPPGASTFNLSDWDISTRDAWRDVVITKKKVEEQVQLADVDFSDVMRAYSKLSIM